MRQYIKSFEIFENENFINDKWNGNLQYFFKKFRDYVIEYAVRPIYRGMKTKRLIQLEPEIYYGKHPHNRTSFGKSSYNFYNLIIDHGKAWKNFPKRSESFICTNNYQTAEEYGSNIFCVIPVNYRTVDLASCKGPDIWISFRKNKYHKKLNYFSIIKMQNEINNLINKIQFGDNVKNYVQYFENYKQLEDLCKLIDSKLYELNEDEYTIIELIKEAGSTMNFLEEIVQPISHSITKYNKLNEVTENDNEIWFSDDVIAIKINEPIEYYSNFLENFIK